MDSSTSQQDWQLTQYHLKLQMNGVISFEGCVGAGKTSLTDYFSRELGVPSLFEQYDRNPFLGDFYSGLDVKLETEAAFLLIHYSQLKQCSASQHHAAALADFSIEKDWVYALLNLENRELAVFEQLYQYAVERVGLPDVVIYLDLSPEVLRKRILQRGRPYELDADPEYFREYNNKVREYYRSQSSSTVHFFNVDDLELDPKNQKLGQIRNTLLEVLKQT